MASKVLFYIYLIYSKIVCGKNHSYYLTYLMSSILRLKFIIPYSVKLILIRLTNQKLIPNQLIKVLTLCIPPQPSRVIFVHLIWPSLAHYCCVRKQFEALSRIDKLKIIAIKWKHILCMYGLMCTYRNREN